MVRNLIPINLITSRSRKYIFRNYEIYINLPIFLSHDVYLTYMNFAIFLGGSKISVGQATFSTKMNYYLLAESQIATFAIRPYRLQRSCFKEKLWDIVLTLSVHLYFRLFVRTSGVIS